MWLLVGAGLIFLVGFVAFTGAPYVPSRRADINRLFTKLRPLTARDVVVDIGSGDGVVLRTVSSLGAQAVGYEIHPLLVLISRVLSRGDPRVRVQLANFWRKPLPDDVTIVYTFGEGRDIAKMYARVEQEASRLGRPLTFVSYAFDITGIKPDASDKSYFVYEVKPLQAS
jgi:hypothetical protein